ncbi:multidrug ABC superfamily ATP binding cassette transporter, ABC protein [Sporosarcina newyorkensis 2681]|uniref:Multidrug ABC superfamily ATP binding cassette transporter, ABC protein n=1 Tax=Sporosarcina newyorkensis 2681 TaxID=1027292 RepID=F9DTC7_9BACL|nr:multidrug ABC superfamily ATP binding cassette transporter, ABC protein [Sporosarcina newyorkensis 2681]
MQMLKIIEVNGLQKSYGSVHAVQDISFYVEKGSLFSFLGTNGAGKSTTISIILTLLQHDTGDVKVNGLTVGKDDESIRKEIGVVFQDSLLDPLLTVRENLDLRARFYRMSKYERGAAIGRVAEIVDITAILERRYGKLSGGQKRRVDIARALLHQPKILLLDEPTTGLDPQNRKQIWNTILQLQRDTGMTVFLTTHYIEEAANSDFVVVMKEGRIIARGTPNQLKTDYSADRLVITAANHSQFRNQLQADQLEFREENASYILNLQRTTDAIPLLAKYQDDITSFEVMKSSLDDVFIQIHNGKDGSSDAGIC